MHVRCKKIPRLDCKLIGDLLVDAVPICRKTHRNLAIWLRQRVALCLLMEVGTESDVGFSINTAFVLSSIST